MIILGIDPGTATTGWGIINSQLTANREHPPAGRAGRTAKTKDKKSSLLGAEGCSLSLVGFGCILTESQDPMGERLLVLKNALKKIIKTCHPDCVVIEQIFFGANSTSAISVGQARGVALLTATEFKLPIFEYTGLAVKLAVADHGRADKKSIQIAVRKHLCVKKLPKPKDQLGRQVFRFRDDAYDAVAAAICHVLKTGTGDRRSGISS